VEVPSRPLVAALLSGGDSDPLPEAILNHLMALQQQQLLLLQKHKGGGDSGIDKSGNAGGSLTSVPLADLQQLQADSLADTAAEGKVGGLDFSGIATLWPTGDGVLHNHHPIVAGSGEITNDSSTSFPCQTSTSTLATLATSSETPPGNSRSPPTSRRRRVPSRMHQCETCSHSFANSSNLVRHERIHTGEQPYRCTFCSKSFNNSSNRRKHETTCRLRDEVSHTVPQILAQGCLQGSDQARHNIKAKQPSSPRTTPAGINTPPSRHPQVPPAIALPSASGAFQPSMHQQRPGGPLLLQRQQQQRLKLQQQLLLQQQHQILEQERMMMAVSGGFTGGISGMAGWPDIMPSFLSSVHNQQRQQQHQQPLPSLRNQQNAPIAEGLQRQQQHQQPLPSLGNQQNATIAEGLYQDDVPPKWWMQQ